ncbi:Flp pilus assembly complex ATPase component TadA [bacterium]|nr:Flp pilus assembly complex ATPase component TadA [candidate division CSSED10-310 bacterium]
MSNTMKKRIAVLFERTGNLLERGVPLLKTLETLSSEADEMDGDMINAMIGLIRSGDTLAQSLGRMKFLPAEVLESIRTGEDSGKLDTTLKSLAGRLMADQPELPEPRGVGLLLEAVKTQYHDVLKQVNRLLIEAMESRASDLHLEPTEDGGRVRLRIDGVLKEQPDSLDPLVYRAIVGRIKEMAALDPGEHKIPQDGRIMLRQPAESGSAKAEEKRLDLRVSVCPFIHGEKVVIRYLDRNAFPQGFEHIRVSVDKIAMIRRWLASPYGMILVSGPTGSGKTTTLYLLLKELSERGSLNVISIEDPVEYILPHVYQMQVNPAIGLTFPAALRSVMRQDPDAVSAGEIRNPETATLLAQLAQTGHVVLSQLHARNADATLRLMQDLGVPAHVLRETVIGVISQRLVRRLCPDCKAPVPDTDRRMMPDILRTFKGPIYRAIGCDTCHGTGYRGRDVVMELLEPGSGYWRLPEPTQLPPLRDAGKKSSAEPCNAVSAAGSKDVLNEEFQTNDRIPGFRSLLDDGYARVMEGVTSFEEIGRVLM